MGESPARRLLVQLTRDDEVAGFSGQWRPGGRHSCVGDAWSDERSAPQETGLSNRADDQGGAMSREANETGALLSTTAERAVELAILGGRQGRREFIERVRSEEHTSEL